MCNRLFSSDGDNVQLSAANVLMSTPYTMYQCTNVDDSHASDYTEDHNNLDSKTCFSYLADTQ